MISLVIPCYNEGDKLYQNVLTVVEYMQSKMYHHEIILSNDGSKDDTYKIMLRLEEEFDDIRIVSSEINKGKGFAVNSAMKIAKGDKIIFMDADLATDLSAMPKTIELLDSVDVVIGSRRIKGADIQIKQPLHRQIIGHSCVIITNLLIPLNLDDTQCGFKGFTAKVVQEIFPKQTVNGFAFDVELLYISKLLGYSISEIPVIWNNSETTTVRAGIDSINFFKQLIEIRKNKTLYLK